MKARIAYAGNTYGNEANAPRYAVRISRNGAHDAIEIDFNLDAPAEGRGVGFSQGSVKSVRLSLPPTACRALADGLQVALAPVTTGAVDFKIDEAKSV